MYPGARYDFTFEKQFLVCHADMMAAVITWLFVEERNENKRMERLRAEAEKLKAEKEELKKQ